MDGGGGRPPPIRGNLRAPGCIPKKVLVSAAEAVHAVRAMAGRGVRARDVSIDWPELMAACSSSWGAGSGS